MCRTSTGTTIATPTSVLVSSGATIEGAYLTGAAFSLTVAKRAPTVVLDVTHP